MIDDYTAGKQKRVPFRKGKKKKEYQLNASHPYYTGLK